MAENSSTVSKLTKGNDYISAKSENESQTSDYQITSSKVYKLNTYFQSLSSGVFFLEDLIARSFISGQFISIILPQLLY